MLVLVTSVYYCDGFLLPRTIPFLSRFDKYWFYLILYGNTLRVVVRMFHFNGLFYDSFASCFGLSCSVYMLFFFFRLFGGFLIWKCHGFQHEFRSESVNPFYKMHMVNITYKSSVFWVINQFSYKDYVSELVWSLQELAPYS